MVQRVVTGTKKKGNCVSVGEQNGVIISDTCFKSRLGTLIKVKVCSLNNRSYYLKGGGYQVDRQRRMVLLGWPSNHLGCGEE